MQTPYSKITLEKLIKNFAAVNGNGRFITVFTTARMRSPVIYIN